MLAGRVRNRSLTPVRSTAVLLTAAAVAVSSTNSSSRSGRAARAGPSASRAAVVSSANGASNVSLRHSRVASLGGRGVDVEARCPQQDRRLDGQLPLSFRYCVIGERRHVLDHAGRDSGRLDGHGHRDDGGLR